MVRPLPLLVVATLSLFTGRAATADCMPSPARPARAQRQVVFLGQFQDLLGHRASFFVDLAHGNVIGPVDHDPWPGTPRRSTSWRGPTPGTVGTLTLTTISPTVGPITAGGWFGGFRATRTTRDLATLTASIHEPFVLGLLAPTTPAAEAKVDAWRASSATRDPLMIAAQGLLYAATGARAQRLLSSIRYRDLAGARLDRIATLRDGGIAAVAKLAAEPAKSDWTDYLPELAAAWLSKRDLTATLDDLLLGQLTPDLPIDVPDLSMNRDCGPSRADQRGPFASPGELTDLTLRDLVRRRDRAFAARSEAALSDVSAGTAQFVVAVRADRVLITGLGNNSISALRANRPIALGSRIDYVARGPRNRYFELAHLDTSQSAIDEVGTATRLTVHAVDVPAMVSKLKADARSGSTPVHAGAALATLFELAGKVPGWSLASARQHLVSLPGNRYQGAREYTQAWAEILTAAIRLAPDATLARELERALPAILATMARGARARPTPLPADHVRRFLIELATEIVARRLIANDLAGAARFVALADGPLKAVAGATAVAAEGPRDSNDALRLQTLAVLVGALGKRPAPLPIADHRAHARALFNATLRPYAPSVRDPWVRVLDAAGYANP